jgi:hypothetical protein
MQAAEWKALIDGASEQERLLMSAYLHIKNGGAQSRLGQNLAEAVHRVRSGEFASLEQAWELHRQLQASGL